MNKPMASIVSKLNPAVPRHYLFALAGLMWTTAGALLCVRAIIWLNAFSLGVELALEFASAGLAVGGYLVLFIKIVQKNIDRIRNLPDHACVFAFTAWTGYLMIGLMMTLGITLRNTSLPRLYLAIPYAIMGTILLIGSVRFFRQFALAFARRNG